MINVVEKDMRDTVTAIHTKEIFCQVKLMEKVSILGPTEKSMMANGPKESRKAMVCGEASSAIAIWDNGTTVKLTAMESINGKTVIATKAAGSTVSNMAKALTFSQTATPILATTMKESLTARAYTNGRMVAYTQVISKMV